MLKTVSILLSSDIFTLVRAPRPNDQMLQYGPFFLCEAAALMSGTDSRIQECREFPCFLKAAQCMSADVFEAKIGDAYHGPRSSLSLS